jgi:S-DNA-T family DNA segregation ATPase FtsK/SpoIIIE
VDYLLERVSQLAKLERSTFYEEHIIEINSKDARKLVFKLNGSDIRDWRDSKYKLEALFNCIVCGIEVAGHYDEYVEITMLDLKYGLREKYYLPSSLEADKDEIVLGEGLFEKVKIDLNQTKNILISGIAGSGKSVLINGLVLQLIDKGHQTILKSVRLDHENSLLDRMRELNDLLENLKSEVKLRKKLLRKKFVKDIVKFNSKVKKENQLKRLVVVIDEFEMLGYYYGLRATKEQVEFEDSIKSDLIKLAADLSGTGVHLIISTQYRINSFKYKDVYRDFDTSICGYTPDEEESIIAIGNSDATRMPNIRGRFLINIEGKLKQFQAYHIERDDADDFAYNKVEFLSNTLKENRFKVAIENIFKILKEER